MDFSDDPTPTSTPPLRIFPTLNPSEPLLICLPDDPNAQTIPLPFTKANPHRHPAYYASFHSYSQYPGYVNVVSSDLDRLFKTIAQTHRVPRAWCRPIH